MAKKKTNAVSVYNPLKNETYDEYVVRLGDLKASGVISDSWTVIAELIAKHFNIRKSESPWRKFYKTLCTQRELQYELSPEESDSIYLKKEKYKIGDIKTEYNRAIRNQAREETLIELSAQIGKQIEESGNMLKPPKKIKVSNTDRAAILCISDWHYGIEVENSVNIYNPKVCVKRVEELRDKTINILEKENINNLTIVNLGDMIAGLIHNSIRFSSRVDAVTQTREVGKILSEFIYDLSKVASINYYDTVDNHSRIDQNKDNTSNLCQLSHFITDYLNAKFEDNPNVVIHTEKPLGQTIAAFKLLGYNIAGAHGDNDKPAKAINNIIGYARERVDLVLLGHRHHFSADEQNFTVQVCNGSLMGTDEYAEKLRLSSNPSQNLIVVSKENICEIIYKINLTEGVKNETSVFQ